MTVVNLRAVRLASGELYEDRLAVALDPLELGGQRYQPVPERPDALFTMARATSGTVFRLRFGCSLSGPCVRCLGDAAVPVRIDAREYQGSAPASEEERTQYLVDDRLDVSAWARDEVALALPEKLLCRADCAGLCAGCGVNLNVEACRCGPAEPDPRLAVLAELREKLGG
jgi:uncharacterized protein